jgi:hypothetical protein
MTDDDDSDIKRLFERTAREPSSFELTRMAARARELPARLERVPRRLPRWTWAPAFAAFAALGALGVTLTQTLLRVGRPESPPSEAPLPSSPAPATPSAPSVRAELSSTASAAPGATPEDAVELETLFNTEDDDPFDLSNAEEMELSK